MHTYILKMGLVGIFCAFLGKIRAVFGTNFWYSQNEPRTKEERTQNEGILEGILGKTVGVVVVIWQ